MAAPISLTRVTFHEAINTAGGGAASLDITSPKVSGLEYDLDTLTIKVVRGGVVERVPVSNVKAMRFASDAPPTKKVAEPVKPLPLVPQKA